MNPPRMSLTAAALVVLLAAPFEAAADPLPAFTVDPAQTSVSGLSSGAYMAGQFHVAFSGTIVGAGIVAAGPYDCAEGQLPVALQRCMATNLGRPDPAHLLERARAHAAAGRIDALEGLADDRVYVFSGSRDDTVTPPVAAQVAPFYRLAGLPEVAIRVVDDLAAGHAFITEAEGNACDHTCTPFINDCDYDQAGDLLTHILGPLDPPSDEPAGSLISFDQNEFIANPTAHGMGATGFAYVPDTCAAGETCRLHIAFHGCRQTTADIGDAFLTLTGYNRWADTNALIVLYPQAHPTPANPNACWDWCGYDDPAYATRTGRQMAAVGAMLQRVAGSETFCVAQEAFNAVHWQNGRARTCGFWSLCAVGSDERLGLLFSRTTLYESPRGRYGTRSCLD
jgi:poly(3-hydroxybutyrate) depolymerase